MAPSRPPPFAFGRLMTALLVASLAVIAWRGGIVDALVGARRASSVLRATSHPSPSPSHGTAAGGGGVRSNTSQLSTAQKDLAAVQRLIGMGFPLYCAGGRHNMVALTFDDGPGPYTERTLAILRQAGVRATFFIVGRNLAWYPGRVEQEIHGNAVGDHTWTHAYLTKVSLADQEREIESTRVAVAKAAKGQVVLFRPPGGFHDASVDLLVNEYGMLEVMWSTDSRDSAPGTTTQEVLQNAIAGLKPGAIILMHENRGTTLQMLPTLLGYIAEHGYQAVTLPELLRLDPPTAAQMRKNAAVGGCVA
jgi:peptidoglycan/xylan/chitin deacetylase (PgdA/CDA1 family)